MKLQYVDRGILVHNTLIISDLHLGMEASMRKKGTLVPNHQIDQLLKDIKSLLTTHKPKHVIINGDLKHDFGTISDQEWREVKKVIRLIQEHAQLTLIKGNHDKVTEIIAEKTHTQVTDHFLLNDIYICHGDTLQENEDFTKATTIIIGHEHPAFALEEDNKRELYKCFMKTTYQKKILYVLPSFSQLTIGTDIQEHTFLSPFLQDIKKAHITITQNKELFDFGEITF